MIFGRDIGAGRVVLFNQVFISSTMRRLIVHTDIAKDKISTQYELLTWRDKHDTTRTPKLSSSGKCACALLFQRSAMNSADGNEAVNQENATRIMRGLQRRGQCEIASGAKKEKHGVANFSRICASNAEVRLSQDQLT